jgi:hypothetical protein
LEPDIIIGIRGDQKEARAEMAERTGIEEIPRTSGRVAIYPWNDWLDGGVWRLRRGEDYEPTDQVMRNICMRAGERRGLKVQTSSEGEGVLLIQAHSVEEE